MKKKIYVYVLSRKGRPLMPTTRLGKVRKLLKSGKAVPVCNEPFTIRLKYDTEDIVQDLYFGQDTGRENIGVAVSNGKGECVFRANVETKNKQIRQEMDSRRGYRVARRLHKRQSKQRKALRNKQDMKHGEDDILRHRKPCKSIEFKALKRAGLKSLVGQKQSSPLNRRLTTGSGKMDGLHLREERWYRLIF